MSSLRNVSMETIVSWAKRRGFVWKGAELYGGVATGYDYGPLGAQLKHNLTRAWWRDFVECRGDCFPLETSLVLNPRVWEASGHVSQFVDPLSECGRCKKRVRADKAVGTALAASDTLPQWLQELREASLSLENLGAALKELNVACPECGAQDTLGQPRSFNLLFQTHVGSIDGDGSVAYLRPETAQGAYVHFLNILNATRRRLPLGVGQVGKSFRNEIAPGNFLFRTREFDQMELQYFVNPENSQSAYHAWVDSSFDWLVRVAGLSGANLRRREYGEKELAHYAQATTDIMYKYPFGWEELMGIANRGDYDLKAHSNAAGIRLKYTDPDSGKMYFPHVVEPALGLNRLMLAVFCEGLKEEVLSEGDTRLVFQCAEDLAPTQVLILPITKKEKYIEMAQGLVKALLPHCRASLDVTGTIGKRYRRGDEDGTPLCATIDDVSLQDGSVTLRDRDKMSQVRVSIKEVLDLAERKKLKPSSFSFPPENKQTITLL